MPKETRHLVDVDSLTDSDIKCLLNRACALASGADPARLQRTAANLFFEPSTRTRISFELAALRLSMRVVNIELGYSSATKGESLEDTISTLAAMGVDCIALRHPGNGLFRQLVGHLPDGLHLINAGEGTQAHPSQALLDAATLKARGADFSTMRVAIVGDIRHSRVAGSGLRLWQRLGVDEVRLAGPADLMPVASQRPAGVYHCASLEEAVRDADVIMMLRIQRERMDQAGWPDSDAYFQEWGLKTEHLALARPGCMVMHPGPINRGVEIAPDVADGDRSLILDQVRMGVFVRMAVFEWMFGER